MKIHKIIYALTLVVLCTACNQSGSDKEKMVQETTQEIIDDAATESSSRKSNTYTISYPKSFCELLTKDVIKSVYPNASNFRIAKGREKRPECEINFMVGNSRGAVRVMGQKPKQRRPYRSFLEDQMELNKNFTPLNGLGDEAYLFPNKFAPNVIVIKDELTYFIQLNYYSDNASEEAVTITRAVMANL